MKFSRETGCLTGNKPLAFSADSNQIWIQENLTEILPLQGRGNCKNFANYYYYYYYYY